MDISSNPQKSILVALLAMTFTGAAAQSSGLWTSAEIQKKLGKNFSLDAGYDFRLEGDWKQPARHAFGLGLSYKPTDYVSLSAGYVFIHDYSFTEDEARWKDGTLNGYNVDHAFWRNKHRATFDVTGRLPVGRFTISLRERYQYTHSPATSTTRGRYRSPLDENMNPEDWGGELYYYNGIPFTKYTIEKDDKRANDRHYLRSRIGVEYNIRHCAWTPYLSYEFSNDLSHKVHLDKERLTVGAEWKITKQHRLDFAYVWDNGKDDDSNGDTHALSIGYKFKF